MNADATLSQVHARLQGLVKITTNIMTTEGRKIVITWHHEHNDGTRTSCLVMGDSIDESLRKVLSLEEDFHEMDAGLRAPTDKTNAPS